MTSDAIDAMLDRMARDYPDALELTVGRHRLTSCKVWVVSGRVPLPQVEGKWCSIQGQGSTLEEAYVAWRMKETYLRTGSFLPTLKDTLNRVRARRQRP